MKLQHCLNCNNEFKTWSGKFCSQSCAAIFNNAHRHIEREIKYKTKKTAVCTSCGISFDYYPSISRGLYCSNKCRAIYDIKTKTLPLAQQGLISQHPTLKKILTLLRGYKCEKCGISQWNDTDISLHLDHIDGDSDNNNLENLRLLCPNCHSQTDTFCSRNKKNCKRSTYNKRYRLKRIHNVE